MPKRDSLHYLKTIDELSSFKEKAIFIMQKKKYLNLPPALKSQFNILVDEKAGHVSMMALIRKHDSLQIGK